MASPPPPPRALRAIPRACLAATTAIAFDDSSAADGSRLLLLAQACTVRVYRMDAASGGTPASSPTLLDSMRVFDGQRIHGLCCIALGQGSSGRGLVVWGGKEMAILQLHPDGHADHSGYLSRLWSPAPRSDIVWDVRALRPCAAGCTQASRCSADSDSAAMHSTDFELAVGYANDRVEVLAFSSRDSSPSHPLSCRSPYAQLQCADRSLLYSLRFHGDCRHKLLAIGGTVFSHILIWDASIHDAPTAAAATDATAVAAASSIAVAPSAASSACKPLTRPVLHRLQGHEGVIFHLDCLPDVCAITSVSDDRALRIWRWQAAAASSDQTRSTAASTSSATAEASLTWDTLIDPSAGSFVCTAALYEHRARVWRCLMPSAWSIVVSASEDGSACIWHAHTGELLLRLTGQRGSLWALALSSAGVLATGAGDGTVRLHDLKPMLRKARLLPHAAADDGMESTRASSDADDERIIVLRVAELVSAPHASAPSSSSPAPAAGCSSPEKPPSKKARVGGGFDAAATAVAAAASATTTGDSMVDVPSDASAVATAYAAPSAPADYAVICVAAAAVPSSSKNPAAAALKKTAAPAPLAAAEFCRELLLANENESDAASDPSLLFLITSAGRIMRLDLARSAEEAAATTTTTTTVGAQSSSADSMLSRAQLLYHHTLSSAPLVSLALSPCKSALAIGDQRGNLLLVSTRCSNDGSPAVATSLWTPNVHASAAAFVHWIPSGSTSSSSSSGSARLLTGDAIGEVKLWSVSRDAASQFEMRLVLAFKLPIKARVTCALVVPQLAGEGELLLLGDSRGSVYLYALLPSSSSPLSASAVAASSASSSSPSSSALRAWALCRLVEAHDKCAVSSLALEPSCASAAAASSASSASASRTIWSTGRNGSVVEYALTLTRDGSTALSSEDGRTAKHNGDQMLPASAAGCSLVKRRVHKISALSSVESISFAAAPASESSRLVVTVHGFHASCLVHWNLSQHAEERRWDIGGPSRSWSRGGGGGGGGWLAYTRHAASAAGEGEIVLHTPSSASAASSSSSAASSGPLSIGTPVHARLTTSLVCIPTRSTRSSSLIVTGSEDNSVKIYSAVHAPSLSAAASHPVVVSHSTAVSCLATVVDHPDVVRCLAWSPESLQQQSHLLFSAGGRDSLFATRIRVAGSEEQPSVAVDSLGSISSAHAVSSETQAKKKESKKKKNPIHADVASADAVSLSAPSLADDRLSQLDLRIMALTAFEVPADWMHAESAAHSSASSSSSSSSSLSGSGVHLIALGNSAGIVQFYLFTPQLQAESASESASASARFRLLAQSAAHSFTILCMAHLALSRDVLLVSGDTNGAVMCWSARSIFCAATSAIDAACGPLSVSPLHSFGQHQSGVDCLAPLVLPSPSPAEDRFALFSGGDDTALSVCGASLVYGDATIAAEIFAAPGGSSPAAASVPAAAGFKCRLVGGWSVVRNNAHASAIRSLAVHEAGSRLYSAGYDQRVRAWRLELLSTVCSRSDPFPPTVALHLVGSCFADVLDVTTLRIMEERPHERERPPAHTPAPTIVLAGQGWQIMQIVEE